MTRQRTSPELDRAFRSLLRAPENPPVFDLPHETRQRAIDCETVVGDLMRSRTEPALWAALAKEEPRLLSALAGLQFICSLLQSEREKRQRDTQ